MAKIYIVRGVLTSLKILEVELIKQTPEQLKIDQKSVKILWNGGRDNFIPYLASRVNRHSIIYFHTLPEAIEEAVRSTQKMLDTARDNANTAEVQLTKLTIFANTPKEESDAV